MVLMTDLWDEHGVNEVNLVRTSTSAPNVSISNAIPVSFPPPNEVAYTPAPPPVMRQHPGYPQLTPTPSYGQPPSRQMYGQPPQMPHPHQQMQPQMPHHQQMHSQQPQMSHHVMPHQNMQPQFPPPGQYAVGHAHVGQPPHPAPAPGMFTRNLIGSLSVNAFKLEDEKGTLGIWFILQDLSVRTEGAFRYVFALLYSLASPLLTPPRSLKWSFVDVGDKSSPGVQLNQGRANVLATCYSDCFTVYSAKKFPGVIESTALSKKFAAQGIKIPIRKDTKGIVNADEYEDDD